MDYSKSARSDLLSYVLTAGGLFMAAFIFSLDLSSIVSPTSDPRWLIWVAGVLALGFSGASILAMIRNWQWGSRIDSNTRELVWWEGYSPIKENRIPISEISRIVLQGSGALINVTLKNKQGEILPFPDRCAPTPVFKWAQALGAAYPEIEIVDFSSLKHKV